MNHDPANPQPESDPRPRVVFTPLSRQFDLPRVTNVVWFGDAKLPTTYWAEPNWLSRFCSLFRRRRKKHTVGDFQYPPKLPLQDTL